MSELDDHGHELPLTAFAQTAQQYGDALERLFVPSHSYLRFPWQGVHDAAGMMAPGQLWTVGARTGHGKTTFLLDLFDRLTTDGRPVLFVGLEQPAHELRVKWGALRCGVSAEIVMAPSPEDFDGAFRRHALEQIQADLLAQAMEPLRSVAHFAGTRRINRARLAMWAEWAKDHDCDALIVDHVDRMDHGDGRNAFHDLSETVVAAKELAVTHEMVMILASQVGRPKADPVQRFTPPALHELRGAGTKEEESDAVLAVYRPLRPDVEDSTLTDVRRGLKSEGDIYQPGTMAVRVLKHRLQGSRIGNTAYLTLEHGRLTDQPERDRYATQVDGMRSQTPRGL